MSVRCITIEDLSTLLEKSVGQIRRTLTKFGLDIEPFRGEPAVNWESLTRELDAQTLRNLNAAAAQRHFDLTRLRWTVASFPELAAGWDHKRNGDLTPSEVSFSSSKVVWWICPASSAHVWKEAPQRRIVKHPDGSYATRDCPFCSHRQPTVIDTLASKYPNLAREWHPKRNGKLTPNAVAPASKKTVWWQCAKNHVWQGRVSLRTSGSGECPYCSDARVTRETSLATMEPALAAEWHPSKNHPLTPYDVKPGFRGEVWWKCPGGQDHVWEAAPSRRLRAPRCPFCINRRTSKDNCLARKFPELARQWHPTKNGTLTPYDVVSGTSQRVWWQCEEGIDHEWECPVTRRTFDNHGCPFCAGKQVSVTNSLQTRHPKIAEEWHRKRNHIRWPANVLATTTQVAWWKCQHGHEWPATVRSRTVNGHGCPMCEKLDSKVVRRRGR